MDPPRSLPLLLLALAACGDAGRAARRPAREERGEGASRVVRSLEALGHAGSTDREGEEGVTVRDAARMQPGSTLYSVQELGLARLVDEEGNVLVFDNGLFRGWSRVVEVDPASGEIVWSHPDVPAEGDPGPARFHSASRGSCQRLANGDTLLCVSDEGLVLEVTPEHETVWRFVSPERVQERGEERRATLVGAYRVPRDLVEGLENRR